MLTIGTAELSRVGLDPQLIGRLVGRENNEGKIIRPPFKRQRKCLPGDIVLIPDYSAFPRHLPLCSLEVTIDGGGRTGRL